MNICEQHWGAMRRKLELVGIGHIGVKNEKQAMAAIAASLERGTEEVPTAVWDPLMSMNFAFWSRALEVMGLAAMAPDFGCPLCHTRATWEHHHPETKNGKCGDPGCAVFYPPGTPPTDEEWIEGCGDSMYREAVARGLVKPSWE